MTFLYAFSSFVAFALFVVCFLLATMGSMGFWVLTGFAFLIVAFLLAAKAEANSLSNAMNKLVVR